MALNERHLCVKVRRLKLFALKQEVVRRVQLLRHRNRAVTRWRHSSLQAAQLQPALTPFIMAAFEAARVRSPATLVAHLCMLHVLTDVRSSRAHRLWSASQFLRSSASERSRRRRLVVLEQMLECAATGAAQERWYWPRPLLPAHGRGAP